MKLNQGAFLLMLLQVSIAWNPFHGMFLGTLRTKIYHKLLLIKNYIYGRITSLKGQRKTLINQERDYNH